MLAQVLGGIPRRRRLHTLVGGFWNLLGRAGCPLCRRVSPRTQQARLTPPRAQVKGHRMPSCSVAVPLGGSVCADPERLSGRQRGCITTNGNMTSCRQVSRTSAFKPRPRAAASALHQGHGPGGPAPSAGRCGRRGTGDRVLPADPHGHLHGCTPPASWVSGSLPGAGGQWPQVRAGTLTPPGLARRPSGLPGAGTPPGKSAPWAWKRGPVLAWTSLDGVAPAWRCVHWLPADPLAGSSKAAAARPF